MHELVLVEGRFGLGTHRGWDVSPGLPGKEEASNLWRGETAANFGRRASRQGAGWEDKGGGGVAGGGEKFQVEGTTCKGTGQETTGCCWGITTVGETGKEGGGEGEAEKTEFP